MKPTHKHVFEQIKQLKVPGGSASLQASNPVTARDRCYFHYKVIFLLLLLRFCWLLLLRFRCEGLLRNFVFVHASRTFIHVSDAQCAQSCGAHRFYGHLKNYWSCSVTDSMCAVSAAHPACIEQMWCISDWRGPEFCRSPPDWCCRTGLVLWCRSAGGPSAAPGGSLWASLNQGDGQKNK